MTISCIIATYHREQLLARAVESVLQQQVDAEFEVIVLNDAGEPLSPAGWQEDPRVRVYDTNKVERCFAWNAGASVARGEWLHVLGDDDVLLEGAYAALVDAVLGPAVWVQGRVELVTRDDQPVDHQDYPSLAGNVFALSLMSNPYSVQSALVKRSTFLSVGGFDPFFSNAEDRELLTRVALCGPISCVRFLASRVRMGDTSASLTQWRMRDQMERLRRDKAFAISGCLLRIVQSLRENPDGYLRGRIARFYLGSTLRHLRGGAISVAASRLFAAGMIALPGLASRMFWSGLRGEK